MSRASSSYCSATNIKKTMDGRIANDPSGSLHNQLANFVLKLQTDVRLEDLLDNNDNASPPKINNVQATQQADVSPTRTEMHMKHLLHLYNEIKNQQRNVYNAHDQSRKRRQNESTFERQKMVRNSTEILPHDTDCLDEAWLLSVAAQLGLDRNMELPVLNSDFMQDLL